MLRRRAAAVAAVRLRPVARRHGAGRRARASSSCARTASRCASAARRRPRHARERSSASLLIPASSCSSSWCSASVLTFAPQLHNVPHNPLEDMLRNRWDAADLRLRRDDRRRRARRNPARLHPAPLRAVSRRRGGGARRLQRVFGLGHLEQGIDAAIATGAARGLWGVIYLARGSIVAPMVGHAGFNLAQLVKYRDRSRLDVRQLLASPNSASADARRRRELVVLVAAVPALAAGGDAAALFVRRDPVLLVPPIALVRPRRLVRERVSVLLRSRHRAVGRLPRDVPRAQTDTGRRHEFRRRWGARCCGRRSTSSATSARAAERAPGADVAVDGFS